MMGKKRENPPSTGRVAMDKPAGGPQQVQIQIDAGDAEGIYSNFVLLAHSSSEFILDFARLLPGVPKAKVYSRIIMTPQNARSLLKALETKIDAYEGQFGKIRIEGDAASSRDIGFKP
jgi:hypothetical protein